VAALALMVPVPSLGVASAMVLWPGELGQGIFLIAKIWLVSFPILWYLAVERGRPSLSPPRRGGLGVGLLLGLAMAGAIGVGGGLVALPLIDREALAGIVRGMDLTTPGSFLAAAAGWTFINSLVEEFVWRFFVLRQFGKLLTGGAAVVAAAVAFTVHHVVALATYLGPGLTALGSVGVFAGGVVWGRCYRRYRSIWPGWISHVLADVAVFALGWLLLFG
jgi:membrane protease YdiL (CAAX protease family)